MNWIKNSTDGGILLCFRRTTSIFTSQITEFQGQYYIYTDGVTAANNATVPQMVFDDAKDPFIMMHSSAGSGNNLQVRLNKTPITVTQSGSVSAENGASGFTVGSREDGFVEDWEGSISEIIVYDRVLSAAEIDDVEAYLESRYNCNCHPVLNVNNDPILDNTYHAADRVISTGLVPNTGNVIFKAGNNIELNPAFEIIQGAQFEATIEPCPN